MRVDVHLQLLVVHAARQVHLHAGGALHYLLDELVHIEVEVQRVDVNIRHVKQPAGAGPLQKAAEDKKCQQQLKNAGLSKEEAERILKQLSKMDRQQIEKMAQKLAERLKKQGVTKQQLEKMLQKMQQRQKACQQCQKMGQCMKKAAQKMEQGQMKGAGKELEKAGVTADSAG